MGVNSMEPAPSTCSPTSNPHYQRKYREDYLGDSRSTVEMQKMKNNEVQTAVARLGFSSSSSNTENRRNEKKIEEVQPTLASGTSSLTDVTPKGTTYAVETDQL
uniref:Uncharacterized protein n=1 Tax=Nelumbo nucifera TaxID=4432 RepID=A0A822XJ05_NELNU|nr:TPA_asm: hypothetical protein HUJ06_021853 [Nelumbo nucifera]